MDNIRLLDNNKGQTFDDRISSPVSGSTPNTTAFSELGPDVQQLGVHDLEFTLAGRDEVSAAVQSLAAQAQRSLLLHTEDLEPAIFDQEPFLEAVSRLARSHSQARIRILIHNSRNAIAQGHRLIELSRRLSSTIQFRRPAAEYRDFREAFLLVDDSGYLHRLQGGRYEGTGNFHDPARVSELRKYFLEVWERSEPDAEIRRLYL